MLYDMRDALTPSRLTIAMWDYSWLMCHYPEGAFNDYAVIVSELKKRCFNTVRIDCFPVLMMLSNNQEFITIEASPNANWGVRDRVVQHQLKNEFLELMNELKKQGVYVILSTWNAGCIEFPNDIIRTVDVETYKLSWQFVLQLLQEHNLYQHVLYVDLDQEFPYFSPFSKHLNLLGESKTEDLKLEEAMELAGRQNINTGLQWNQAQMKFVKKHMDSILADMQFQISLSSF